MEVYKVGGAIRDTLLGLEPSDVDYVVVGSSTEEMLSLGYQQVGLSFPVFLHPETGEEYALARSERSTGGSYVDFSFETTNVSLEDDLRRRDLTINAMAMSDDGTIIDPFGGQRDIEKRTLRHTSEAFVEDPVRVLRIARLRARYGHTWKIAPETKLLIDRMELRFLQPDRVYAEVDKAVSSANSYLFFVTLDELGVLEDIFPYIHLLKSYREGSVWHQEPNVFEHTMAMMKLADESRVLKYCCLYHDIAKPYCRYMYGNGKGHDSAKLAEPMIDIKLPAKLKQTVLFCIENHIRIFRAVDDEMSYKKIAKMFKTFRGDDYLFFLLVELGRIDKAGAVSVKARPQQDFSWLLNAFQECNSYSPKEWISTKDSPSGEAIKQHVHREWINIIRRNHEP